MRRKTMKRKGKGKGKVNKISGLHETRREGELRRSQGKFTKLEKRWLASECEEWEIAHYLRA